MARVSWSEEAERDLEVFVATAAVRDQLRRNAQEVLHDIAYAPRPSCAREADAGAVGEIMWHRGVPHGHERLPEQSDGPQNYFLIYRRQNSAQEFEVLGVRSIHQVARYWEQMSREPTEADLLFFTEEPAFVYEGDHASRQAAWPTG
jgi:hypothetical protein